MSQILSLNPANSLRKASSNPSQYIKNNAAKNELNSHINIPEEEDVRQNWQEINKILKEALEELNRKQK
jgi:sugar (pentulose or hexulose) kinase